MVVTEKCKFHQTLLMMTNLVLRQLLEKVI